ncbi:hypothetical protein BIV04_04910 [Frigoribacterium sp. MCBA15_019]|nr:hypothetical protein BIV04_04910 [Frigoribacterium sp. MCBA15_019]
MPLQPVQRNLDLTTSLPPHEVAGRVADFLHELTHRPTTTARTGIVKAGSRLAYRIVGGVMNAGKKRLPMIVSWSITENGSGSGIHLEMKSDEGTYGFATRWHYQAYEQRFTQLERNLQSRFA